MWLQTVRDSSDGGAASRQVPDVAPGARVWVPVPDGPPPLGGPAAGLHARVGARRARRHRHPRLRRPLGQHLRPRDRGDRGANFPPAGRSLLPCMHDLLRRVYRHHISHPMLCCGARSCRSCWHVHRETAVAGLMHMLAPPCSSARHVCQCVRPALPATPAHAASTPTRCPLLRLHTVSGPTHRRRWNGCAELLFRCVWFLRCTSLFDLSLYHTHMHRRPAQPHPHTCTPAAMPHGP